MNKQVCGFGCNLPTFQQIIKWQRMRDKYRCLKTALWNKANEFEGIPADSLFVVWSEENPYAERYEKVLRRYYEYYDKVPL